MQSGEEGPCVLATGDTNEKKENRNPDATRKWGITKSGRWMRLHALTATPGRRHALAGWHVVCGLACPAIPTLCLVNGLCLSSIIEPVFVVHGATASPRGAVRVEAVAIPSASNFRVIRALLSSLQLQPDKKLQSALQRITRLSCSRGRSAIGLGAR